MALTFVLMIWATAIFSNLEARRILVVPAMTPSHLLQLGSVGHGLIQKGHEVHMLVNSGQKVPGNILKWGVKMVKYHTNEGEVYMETKEFQIRSVKEASEGTPALFVFKVLKRVIAECNNVIGNEDLMRQLRQLKFDFAVVDGSPITACLLVIPYRLGLPYGTVSPFMPISLFSLSIQIPILTPLPVEKEFNDISTFWQRLKSTVMISTLNGMIWYNTDEQALKEKCEIPFETISSLLHKSRIWLIDLDELVDVPKHMPPNMINVGGISTSPPLPLEKEFKTYADSATDGLVIMTFGGTLGFLPEDYVNRIIEGVEKVKYKVIFRQKTKPTIKVPSNLMIVDWMPQNDLLAHPNTKVFVTHCGSNGQHEALYHGVPMLGLPIQGDQIYNADRLTKKGYGKYLDVLSFTPQELANAINDVATNPKYHLNIKKASKIFRSRPMAPRERAAFWIEHVMTYGSDHLQSYVAQLEWYQILLLDVMCFIVVTFLSVVFVVVKCIKLVCRVCCGKARKQKVH